MQSHGFTQTPSQLIPNPEGNASVAMLQSGRTLPESAQRIDESIAKIEHSDEAAEMKEKPGANFIQEKSNMCSVFHLDIIDYTAKEVHDSFNEEFLELFDLSDSIDCFSCDQCDGVELCVKCTEMDAYLMGDGLVSVDTVEKIHVTEIVPFVIQPPKLELEFPPYEHLLGRFEYAYLENDAQLQAICDMAIETSSIDALWCLDYAYKESAFRPRAVYVITIVMHHGNGLRSFTPGCECRSDKDGRKHKITLWDPGGGKRCKPWWEFLDQFKHKPL